MKSLFRVLLLLIHTYVVLADNVGEMCERRQDGTECGDTSEDESHKYSSVHDDSHMSDKNIEIDQ